MDDKITEYIEEDRETIKELTDSIHSTVAREVRSRITEELIKSNKPDIKVLEATSRILTVYDTTIRAIQDLNSY